MKRLSLLLALLVLRPGLSRANINSVADNPLVTVTTGTITVYQGGDWDVEVDTGSITSFQGGAWSVGVSSSGNTVGVTNNAVNTYAVSVTTIDVLACTTISVSTFSATQTAKLIVPANATSVLTMVQNESQSMGIRVGPSSITSSIGFLLTSGAVMTMDAPRYFRGSIYVINTSAVGSVAGSIFQCSP